MIHYLCSNPRNTNRAVLNKNIDLVICPTHILKHIHTHTISECLGKALIKFSALISPYIIHPVFLLTTFSSQSWLSQSLWDSPLLWQRWVLSWGRVTCFVVVLGCPGAIEESSSPLSEGRGGKWGRGCNSINQELIELFMAIHRSFKGPRTTRITSFSWSLPVKMWTHLWRHFRNSQKHEIFTNNYPINQLSPLVRVK